MLHQRVVIVAVATVPFWSNQFARATPPTPGGQTVVDVMYSDLAAPSGPLSLGLRALPEAIAAELILDGTSSLGLNTYGLKDVLSFELELGDATWTANDLVSFSMTTETNLVGNAMIPSSLAVSMNPPASPRPLRQMTPTAVLT